MSKDTKDLLLPWHHFANDSPVEHLRQWRKRDWRNIKRELKELYGLAVPDELEPHWVAPGKAVFWKNTILLEYKRDPEKLKHNVMEILETSLGEWKPTAPQPVGNAAQLHRYLDYKGFRLRPPLSGVEAGLKELIEAVEAADQPEESKPEFICLNHDYITHTWKGYLNHTNHFKEPPDLSQMPDDVREAMKTAEYYCAVHNISFPAERSAIHHVREHARKNWISQPHVKAEDMRVQRPKEAVTA